MKMGVVADDITGANDIGSMFAKWGYVTHVYPYTAFEAQVQDAPDVCIVDTNSRLDAAQTAYDKVFRATRALGALGCVRFHNKTCSVFRGNIGAEFDAMLDALGEDFAVVVLGFPKNGRTTIDGIHYVRGVRLEESEFRHDPIHPMTRSDLVGILQSQTRRRVALLDYRAVQGGSLRQQIDALRGKTNYLILDVTSQDDLKTIAAAVQEVRVLCGSSALAEEIPAHWGTPAADPHPPQLAQRPDLGILCAAGSLMPQTAAQIRHIQRQGAAALTLDSRCLFDEAARAGEIQRLAEAAARIMSAARDVVVHTANTPEAVAAARAEGAKQGFSSTAVSRRVSAGLAEVVAQIVERTGQNRLLIAGGETAAAVCGRLGVAGLRVWKEIQPGLPSCITLTAPAWMLVLKSGSFGTADFFEKAIAHLRAEGSTT